MDIYNAPEWVFFPGVSVQIKEAARELGMSVSTFKRHLDDLGLTVYRHPTTNNRHFLVSEIEKLKELLPTVTAGEIQAARKEDYGILGQIKR
jgi:AraC-like DNA-binding protein